VHHEALIPDRDTGAHAPGAGENVSISYAATTPSPARGGLRGDPVTCRDAIEVLADYLGLTLGPKAVARLSAHLMGCAACRAYLRTYRKTSRLARRAVNAEMPEQMQRRLRAFLVEALTKEGGR